MNAPRRTDAPCGPPVSPYETDALAEERAHVLMRFPDGSHPAIFHPLVDLLPGDGAAGNALAACLAGPVASAVSERHGFGTLPSADAR